MMTDVWMAIAGLSLIVAVVSLVFGILNYGAATRCQTNRERELNHFRNELKQQGGLILENNELLEAIRSVLMDLKDYFTEVSPRG
jgi:hypothetical protein